MGGGLVLVPCRNMIRLEYHRLLLQKEYGIFYVENIIYDPHQNTLSLQTVWQAHMEVTHDDTDTLANLRRLFREL